MQNRRRGDGLVGMIRAMEPTTKIASLFSAAAIAVFAAHAIPRQLEYREDMKNLETKRMLSHKVESGQTVYDFYAREGAFKDLTWSAYKDFVEEKNNIIADNIIEGQVLQLPDYNGDGIVGYVAPKH